jgi:hypothetical protein
MTSGVPLPWKRVTTLLASALVAACGCAKTMTVAQPRPIEVWRGGDDGLTVWFTAAVEEALRDSPSFKEHGEASRTLIATIPTNLRWRDIGDRTRFDYRVLFSDTAKRSLGEAHGECWEDRMAECAARIRKRAEAISARVP